MNARDAHGCLSFERLDQIVRGATLEPEESTHLSACDDCRAQLDAMRDEDALFADIAGALSSPAQETRPEDDAPDGYRFIDEIHRGAQGVVYLAEQLDAKRRVAVKLTLRGAFASSRQRARFDREVELAASIAHPNVVTVYESGATPSGGRYMAMQLVEGLPLDRWFESRRRDPARVARAMAAVASAIEAAHRKGVIHRDLKPSNILVDHEDQPKVVDFGIAKALATDHAAQTMAQTKAGEFVGTLAYAAPEQVAGEPGAVDTRADVYALGALLYEGLTGRRAVNLEGSLGTCIERIREEPPIPPASIDASLPADLSAVALQALEKDPARRYQTAGALRDDLERFLAGEAVHARAHDAIYRFRKWARRRRKRLAAAAVALVALAISAGFAVQSEFARQRALSERQERERVAEVLLRPLAATDTELSNEAVTSLNDYLRLMASTLAGEAPESPELEAAVRSRLGIALTRESSFKSAEAELARALDLWQEAKGDRSPEAAQALHDLARMHWKASDYAAAEPLYREALAIRREALGPSDLETARTAHHLASTVQRLGRFDEAVALYEQALAARRETLGPDDPAVANTLNGLGECYHDSRRYDLALDRFRESHRIIAAAAGERDWRTASAAANIARCLAALGRPDEARPLLAGALEINREWWPADDPRVLRTRLSLAAVEQNAEAAAGVLEALQIRLGPDHTLVAEAAKTLAEAALHERDATRAAEAASRAATLFAARDAGGWRAAEARLIEAEALLALGRDAEAAGRLRQARAALSGTLEPDDPLRSRLARLSAGAAAPPTPPR